MWILSIPQMLGQSKDHLGAIDTHSPMEKARVQKGRPPIYM